MKSLARFVGIFILPTSSTFAHRLYVSSNVPEGGNGTSWENAFRYLQDALEQTEARRGDEIWISDGTYFPDDGWSVTEGDRLSSFVVKDEVSLFGGFSGIELSKEERDPETNQTILSGEIVPGDENKEFWSIHILTLVLNQANEATR